MPIVTSSSATAPFDARTYRPIRRTSPIFQPPRFRKGSTDPYSSQMARHRPVQIDPFMFPRGGLGDLGDPYGFDGLGDLADSATGIPAVDAIIATAQTKIDRLVLATEIGTVAAVVGATFALLCYLDGRRRR